LEPLDHPNRNKGNQNIRNKHKAILWGWHVIRVKWRNKEEKRNWHRQNNRQYAGYIAEE